MESSQRDSILAGRGYSMKLNLAALGKQKSDQISEQEEEDEDADLLNDNGFSDLEELENKLNLVTFEDAMLLTEPDLKKSDIKTPMPEIPEALDSARDSTEPFKANEGLIKN